MTQRDLPTLALLAALFLAWQAPLLFRTVAGQDEHWFGVAGITILDDGVPRIPYMPSTNPAEVCYGADVALYVLPPLSFYLQALVHLAFGRGLGQARLASALEGIAAVVLVYRLGLTWLASRRGATLASIAYILSRAFLFPATTARPDMAATMFGLLGVALIVGRGSAWRVAASGAAVGLSMLAHPFGVVPAIQVGLSILLGPGSVRQRLGHACMFTIAAFVALGLWLPLIAAHPDLFRIQFFGNVLGRAGSGLGSTLLRPWEIVGHQARQAWGHLSAIQFVLYLAGTTCVIVHAFRTRREWQGPGMAFHLIASAALLALFAGRHPTLGYYAYPAAFASIALGKLGDDLASRIGGRLGTILVGLALVLAFLPGAGLRTFLAHVRHRSDPDYDAHDVARRLNAGLPGDSVVAVDCPFVLDFYLAGRPVVAATVYPKFFDVRPFPYRDAVLGRIGLMLGGPFMDDLERVAAIGNPDDPFAAYAEVYRRRRPAQVEGASQRPPQPL